MSDEIKFKTNYEMFLDVVNTLKNSQGFYSRIADTLSRLDDDELDRIKEDFNSQPQFKDNIDVIMFLEG